MTRQQYQQKYGTSGMQSTQPVQMTRQQYADKYGSQPQTTTPEQPKPKSIQGFGENVVKSGGKLIGDTVGAVANVFNPDMEKNTVANVAKLAAGTAQYLDPTQMLGTQYEDKARAVGNFYKDRYGGFDKIGETLYNDPVGVVADVASVATGAGGILKGGASLAGKAGMVSKAGKIANVGSKVAEFGNAIDPVLASSKLAGAGANRVFSKVKPIINNKADDLVTAGLGNPLKQANAEQKAGRTVSSFIDEYKLYNRSPETAKQVVQDIGEKFDATAMQSGKNLLTGKIVQAFDDKINELRSGSNGVIADATAQQIMELERRKQMFLNSIVNNTTQSSPLNVGLDQATTFRRNVIDPDVPKSEFGLNPTDKGKAGGVKASRDIFRKMSIEIEPELKKLGLDYGMAKEMEQIIKSYNARKNNRQMINFSKLGSAGVGSVVAGIRGAIGGYMLEQVINSPYFAQYASKGLKEAVKSRMPAIVGKTADKAYQIGRTGRMLDVPSDQKQIQIPVSITKTPAPKESVFKKKSAIKYPALNLKGY